MQEGVGQRIPLGDTGTGLPQRLCVMELRPLDPWLVLLPLA